MAATVGNGKDREEAEVHRNQRQGGRLLSRLLTRDSSAAAPSFRVYYGVSSAGAVPFLWESQPGTPKNAASDTAMPPLTPPPSYYSAAAKKHAPRKGKAAGGRKFRPSRILGSILMATRRRGRTPPSGSPTSSFSSASTSSSSASSASSFRRAGGGGGGSSSRLHSTSFSDDEETAAAACFRVRHESFRALRGCRVAVTVRSALSSVGGAAVQRV